MKILLERIKSHPEEFGTKGFGRWRELTQNVCTRSQHPQVVPLPLGFLSDAEIAALYEALYPVLAQEFTEMVMMNLLDDRKISNQQGLFSSGDFHSRGGPKGGPISYGNGSGSSAGVASMPLHISDDIGKVWITGKTKKS